MPATFLHAYPVWPPAANRHLAAESIGCRVPRASGEGRLDAVLERACIVMLDTGGLVAVLGKGAGNVAHGIRLACEHRFDVTLERGMPARIVDDRVVLGDGAMTVLLSHARVWWPRFPRGARGCDDRVHATALQVRDLLGRSTSRSEFLAVVLSKSHPRTALAAHVARLLPRLAAAARVHDADDALRLVAQLVGLGPGLTPAGDDFIIGWLAGLTLSAATPARLAFLHAIREGLDALRHATTSISSQHLGDACASMFSEHLSELCMAIAWAAPEGLLAECVSAQTAVGASSGADAAAGLLLALLDCTSGPGRDAHRSRSA